MTGAAAFFALTLALAAQPPAAPAPSPQTQAEEPTANAWLTIYSVLPDRTAMFEQVARDVREALRASTDPVRQAQGRALRIHRSSLPNADGHHLYFVQVPALAPDAERTGLDALIDVIGGDRATTLRQDLTASLNPRNPSGSTYLIGVR